MFRNIPIVTKYLLIINVVVFLIEYLMDSAVPQRSSLAEWGALHFILASDFNPLQFVTYLFLHASWYHLLGNMFALWMFGCMIEEEWGAKKFIIFYILCGIGAGICQEIVQFVEFYFMATSQFPSAGFQDVITILHNSNLNGACTIGASGSVFAVLLAFGMTFPKRVIGVPLTIVALILLDLINTHPMIEGVLTLLNNLFFIAIFITLLSPASALTRSLWRFFFIKPIEARWVVMGYIVLEILFIWKFLLADPVAHMAHLGGALVGFLIIIFWRFMDKKKRMKVHNTYNPTNNNNNWKRPVDDMEYNARKKARQEEVDAILDKIRKSGYDSLTKEEKRRLFEASHEK